MAKLFVAPASQATLTLLTGTVLGVVVIGSLYWAQTVLIPVALAVFLAFPLAPLVTFLQRRHMGRMPSVVVVVLLAALVLGGVLWMVKIEITGLANELPTYTENIQSKVKYLARWAMVPAWNALGKWRRTLPGSGRRPWRT